MSQPNKLITETSPYLLQHAYNPVQWYPWGSEAIEKARREDKPVLVSIGYAACHWCHVMERESFENETVAAYMNEHFINIKIDREERPDLDHIYMDAVQAMTGSGGWPLNVFLTPDLRPFYGGTYFPPVNAFNRSSWMEVLGGIVKAFAERRGEIDSQAENLTEHLKQSNHFGLRQPGGDTLLSTDKMKMAAEAVMKQADKTWGGFGRAPKFPQVFSIRFLLQYSWLQNDAGSRQQALLSLDKMIEGGIYDQLGGGFARYATDTEWLVPHFEKMLYDNALLIIALSEAYQLTGMERYREVIGETLGFISREMTHPGGAFYAALDADSEGEEGKYYVWDMEEIQSLLGEEAGLVASYYDITAGGNWEGKNILRVLRPLPKFAQDRGMPAQELAERLSRARKKMLTARAARSRPQLDDKIILSWNALMITACCRAFGATGEKEYLQQALAAAHFLLEKMNRPDSGLFYHTWKEDQPKYAAFLDDYAFLIQAMLRLQEVTADLTWLNKAGELMEAIIPAFTDESATFFYYTPENQEDIIVRKKEVYDGALPSGNAVMAENLLHLGILLDRPEWRERAAAMLEALGNAVVRYPTSFGHWAGVALGLTGGIAEIAVVGPGFPEKMAGIRKTYLPGALLMGAAGADEGYPLLQKKNTGGQTKIFLCKDYSCLQPVDSVEELTALIHRDGR